jgi:hypothetical protein
VRFLKLNPLPAPQHGRDPAEQFVPGNRRVFLGQRVAAGGNEELAANLDRTDNAMGAKTAVAREENDVPRPYARGGLPQNQKNVTRKDRRKHARASGNETEFAKGMQDLCGKGQFHRWPGLRGWRNWLPAHLGSFPVELALTLGGVEFAAGERHGFKHALVLKGRLPVGLLGPGRLLRRVLCRRGSVWGLIAHWSPD